MCANFKPIQLKQLKALGLPEIQFHYVDEVYPLYETPLLFKSPQGLEWRSVKFGLIPKWATDTEIAKRTYNARNETLHEKRSFQEAFQKHKFGVIPVTEFYEMKYINGKAQRWGVKRKDGKAFFIAAIYEIVKINEQVIRSATMISMDAHDHEMMKYFHEPRTEKRSIIVIPHDRLEEWLMHSDTNIQTFIQGFPAEEFECFYSPKPTNANHPDQLNFF